MQIGVIYTYITEILDALLAAIPAVSDAVIIYPNGPPASYLDYNELTSEITAANELKKFIAIESNTKQKYLLLIKMVWQESTSLAHQFPITTPPKEALLQVISELVVVLVQDEKEVFKIDTSRHHSNLETFPYHLHLANQDHPIEFICTLENVLSILQKSIF